MVYARVYGVQRDLRVLRRRHRVTRLAVRNHTRRACGRGIQCDCLSSKLDSTSRRLRKFTRYSAGRSRFQKRHQERSEFADNVHPPLRWTGLAARPSSLNTGVADQKGNAGFSAYSATKAALRSLARTAAAGLLDVASA